jgi:hypothetical protein
MAMLTPLTEPVDLVDACQCDVRPNHAVFKQHSQKETNEMETTKVHVMARQLRDAHGARAVVAAAQKAARLEAQGNKTEAEIWRRIEAALMEMRGPHAS